MSPQPRSARNRGLPRGLRVRAGYYSWTDPRTGREHGLGRDRAIAVADAIEANLHVEQQSTRSRLVDRLDGSGERTIGAFVPVYEAQLKKRKLAANTARTYASLLTRLRAELGDDAIVERIETLQIAGMLTRVRDQGKERTAQALRSFAKDFFRACVAAGWTKVNPVLVTESPSVEVKRARLTLEVFLAAREHASTWLRNAVDLALVTAQRREDVAGMRFSDVRDGALYVEQQKTGKKIALPLELRLDVVGLSLDDLVRRCRTSGVLSRFLVHQTAERGNSPRGREIWIDTITRRYSDCIAALNLSWGEKTPPTFHEIRSLAERLYKAQGNVDTQELLGHSNPETTALYHDSRGAEWTRVKFGG